MSCGCGQLMGSGNRFALDLTYYEAAALQLVGLRCDNVLAVASLLAEMIQREVEHFLHCNRAISHVRIILIVPWVMESKAGNENTTNAAN